MGYGFDWKVLYREVEQWAEKAGASDTLAALPFATEAHGGQIRKAREAEAYIIHPLTVARHAIALGFENDGIVAAALLHDVVEDTPKEVEDLPVTDEVKEAVRLLTKEEAGEEEYEASTTSYYSGIATNEIATTVKIIDRCNNISEMAEAFDREKILEYIRETDDYAYPLLEIAKERYPMYKERWFLLEYHMSSVLRTALGILTF